MDTLEPKTGHFLPPWLVNTLGGLLVAFVALLIVQKVHEVQTQFANTKPANTLSISGDGKVTATPDLATASFGVTSQGTSAKDVKDQNNQKINKIVAFVKDQGVSKDDIQTSQFYASPVYDYRSTSAPTITGYQSTQTITVKVRGVDSSTDKLNAILGGAVDNGANTFNGVSFSFSDPDKLQQQARNMAIENAKSKAQDLAKTAGLTLGKVVSVSESGNNYPQPIPYGMAPSMGLGGAADSKSITPPSVEPGSQDINETMTVTFELK